MFLTGSGYEGPGCTSPPMDILSNPLGVLFHIINPLLHGQDGWRLALFFCCVFMVD